MSAEALLRSFAEPVPYAVLTLLVLVMVAVLERWRPAAKGGVAGRRRWPVHGGLMLINGVLGSQLGTALIVLVVAWHLPVNHFLMHHYDEHPLAVMVVAVLALDFWQYLFHRGLHAVPLLWRVHRVHHSDRDFDLSTSQRFHPLEEVLSIVWRLALVLALGVPYLVLVVHSLISVVSNPLTHARVQVPAWLDRGLRTVFVTPAMHRVHHSLDESDGGRNFGVIFSFWDRLLRTHRQRSRLGALPPTGIAEFDAVQSTGLWQLLTMPFRGYPFTAFTPLRPSSRSPS